MYLFVLVDLFSMKIICQIVVNLAELVVQRFYSYF